MTKQTTGSLKDIEQIELEKQNADFEKSWNRKFQESWNEADPATAPLLSKFAGKENKEGKSGIAVRENFGLSDAVEERVRQTNFAILPFHHLIPARDTVSGVSEKISREEFSGTIKSYEKKLKICRQSLLEADYSPAELSLFDDSLSINFTNHDENGNFLETHWEVLNYDALEGCAEVYQAELFTIKRRIYEQAENARTVLEIDSRELLSYLNEKAFRILRNDDPEDLFMDSLSASFTLSVSGMIGSEKSFVGQKKRKRTDQKNSLVLSDRFSSFLTKFSRKIESATGLRKIGKISEDFATDTSETYGEQNDNSEPTIYRITLSKYWYEWQRAAQWANFDFELLEKLPNAKAMRFYELTKLLRNLLTTTSGEKLPNKLEIAYDRFTSLMPLPKFRTEREVKEQIKKLILPFKESNYVKSSRVTSDRRIPGDNKMRLFFRFDD